MKKMNILRNLIEVIKVIHITKNNNHSLSENNFILKKQKNPLNKSHFSKKLLLNTKLNNFVMYQEQSKLENKILENVSNINSSTNINIQLKEIKIILKV